MQSEKSFSYKFLGSGSAFVHHNENYQSNVLIETKGKKLLIDAGSDVRFGLIDNNITPNDIDAIFITHLHADHIGGLEYLGFSTFFSGKKHRIKIYISCFLFSDLKDYLEVTMLQTNKGLLDLEDIFEFILLDIEDEHKFVEQEDSKHNALINEPPMFFTWEDIEFYIIRNNHINIPSHYSYGVLFGYSNEEIVEDIKNKIYISGDTQLNTNILKYVDKYTKRIYHDCEFADYEHSVHTQYHELLKLDISLKNKMSLYGYSLKDKSFPEVGNLVMDDGFRSLVARNEK